MNLKIQTKRKKKGLHVHDRLFIKGFNQAYV